MNRQLGRDIEALRALGWSWTRIGGFYGVSEREIRNWSVYDDGGPAFYLAPPLALRFGTALIISDVQFPSHDPALWEAVCQMASNNDVDWLIWDGDLLDFPQLSTFSHNPYKLQTAHQDVADFHAQVRQPLLDALKNTLRRESWLNGNHEYRYTRYLEVNSGALGGGLPPKEFLGLPAEVDFYEYGRATGLMLTPKLLVSHGWQVRTHSAYTARANLDDVRGGISVITGHSHRLGLFMHTGPEGTVAAYEVGHMCDNKAVPGPVGWSTSNWQQCLGTIVRYEHEGDGFHVELAPVFGRLQDRAIVAGREYRISRRA